MIELFLQWILKKTNPLGLKSLPTLVKHTRQVLKAVRPKQDLVTHL